MSRATMMAALLGMGLAVPDSAATPATADPSGLSAHGANDCSTKEDGVDQPSPTQDAWACVEAVCPSTLPES